MARLGLSTDGRAISRALVDAFAERVLPRPLRPHVAEIISVVSPPALRQVHGLPEPAPVARRVVRAAVCAYVTATPVRPVPLDRPFVADFGTRRYGARLPEDVGYRRRDR